jgi:hypothetical protein
MIDDNDNPKPIEEDIAPDDQDYNPAVEPKKAKAWLNLLLESEEAFDDWNSHCDNIDRQYAHMGRLASLSRDKEFQMFWANAEVIKPSIYAKPPQPVVVPKFKDRRPVYQAASEVAERCATVAFDMTRIDDIMKLIRDDVALIGRGVVWCRYDSGGRGGYYDQERVCIEFKNRRDFLHSVSRNWEEVTWVAAASYLTRGQARKRFKKHSGDEYQDAEYKVDKDSQEIGGADNRERAKFWEIWSKKDNRCLWVAHGCEKILDEDDPHLELCNFFPCPRPAYGTVQRGSLVPVPDVLQYKDQLEELNMLTGRIHALSDALEAKGFYPAGGTEMADAIETAVKIKTPGRILVPISNWAAFGTSKEVIVWMPIDMIATTITGLVQLRKQVIEDIYQIMGLADIMRGATDPNETLGAQQLKSEYGSKRIKDKQQELVRMARDLVEITLDIITDKFDPVTIIEMSQTQLPTTEMVQQKIGEVQKQMQGQQMQLRQLMANPQVQQMAQANPEQAQQVAQQAQKSQEAGVQTINQLREKPTINQVLKFLKDNRGKSFVLDIETDSTIMADEQAEKQSRTEFVGMLGGLLPQLAQMIAGEPKTAEFCGELLKFATAPFRAGRSLDGAVDELVEQMKMKGTEQPPNPQMEAVKSNEKIEMAKIEQKKAADAETIKVKQQELADKQTQHDQKLANDRRIAWSTAQIKLSDVEGKEQVQAHKLVENREAHEAHMAENEQKMALDREKAGFAMQTAQAKANQTAQAAQDKRAHEQFKMSQPQPPRRQ